MNYLGHIYFSFGDFELALANLHGDHVKGKDLTHLPALLQKGAVLHREIDFFMDNHPINKDLKKILQTDLPKVSGIAIDLYYDHLLAKNWTLFHLENIDHFLEKVYQSFEVHIQQHSYPQHFKLFVEQLNQYRWLNHYAIEHGLDRMSHGVSRKLSFDNKLTEGLAVFKRYETEIERSFNVYMMDANEHFKQYFSEKMS